MGWDSSDAWKRKQDVVDEMLASYRRADRPDQLIAYAVTRSGLWTVHESKSTGLRAIYLDLIKREGRHMCVKSMCESMGPSYFDCPRKLLALVPRERAIGFNEEWRAQVA